VRLGEELAARDWTDIVRMLTLNGQQAFRNLEKHVCPLQFDIVDRLIDRYSNPGDIVYDPFGGLMTVPYRAILKGRRGRPPNSPTPISATACATAARRKPSAHPDHVRHAGHWRERPNTIPTRTPPAATRLRSKPSGCAATRIIPKSKNARRIRSPIAR
jgi:hypothetical protein